MGQTQSEEEIDDSPKNIPLDFVRSDSILAEKMEERRGSESQTPPLLNAYFELKYNGSEVLLAGDFWSNWQDRIFLEKKEGKFTLITKLPEGRYTYKYIADGRWVYNLDQPSEFDNNGYRNNVLELYETHRESLENIHKIGTNNTFASDEEDYDKIPNKINDIQKIIRKLSYCEPPNLPDVLDSPQYFTKVEGQHAYFEQCIENENWEERDDIEFMNIYWSPQNNHLPYSVDL